jgi:hypothetical protein
MDILILACSAACFRHGGLLGPAQAQAIAWAYAAQVEGTTGAKEIEVRIIEYEVKYDIATTRKEP